MEAQLTGQRAFNAHLNDLRSDAFFMFETLRTAQRPGDTPMSERLVLLNDVAVRAQALSGSIMALNAAVYFGTDGDRGAPSLAPADSRTLVGVG